MMLPGNWHSQIHNLWLAGNRNEAIQKLLAEINKNPQPLPKNLAYQLAYYLFLNNDWHGAASVLTEITKAHPGDLQVLQNLGVCYLRSEQYTLAIDILTKIVQKAPELSNAWDGLANAYSHCQNYEKAKEAGERALALKDRLACKNNMNWHPPTTLPEQFLAKKNKKNIISFSLWGSSQRYLRGALQNVLLAPQIYPGWSCRFYVDDSVPAEFLNLLLTLKAELIYEKNQALLCTKTRLVRRFLVANDSNVGYFLVRDCDSVLSKREAKAVNAWLRSEHWFHVIRDWWTHTELIMAGLWGGVAGILPDVRDLYENYDCAILETPTWDQWFLRDKIWPLIHAHTLVHDRCFRSKGSNPYPETCGEGNYHVGQDEFSVRRQEQEQFLFKWINQYPCLQA